MEDYFAALGLARDATVDQIDAKIRQELRTWQKRTTNPDLARRQEAERRLRLLAEARETLLDDQRRAEYLAMLASPSSSPEATAQDPDRPSRGLDDWLAAARGHLAKSDFASALYAAREARKADGRSAEAWSLLARADMGMGSLREALTEARRASDLEPSNAGYYFVQGRAHEELGQFAEAHKCYEVATRLNPNASAPRLAAAGIVAKSEQPEQALQLLEDVFERSDDKRRTGTALGECLVRVAERVPQHRTDDGYLITSAEEIDAMERLLFRARQVTSDPDVVRHLETVADNVRWAKDRHVRKLGGRSGCLGALAAAAGLAGLFLLFWFLDDLNPVKLLAALLAFAAAGAYAWWVFAPGHALNRASQQR